MKTLRAYKSVYKKLKKELEIYVEKINKLDTEINSLSNIIEETQKDFMNVRSISADNINDFESQLSDVENNNKMPSFIYAVLIARALKIDIGELYTIEKY